MINRFRTFCKPDVDEATKSVKNNDLIDFNRSTTLYQQYYLEMNDQLKILSPLHPISFLGSNK
jgi:restriction system protein